MSSKLNDLGNLEVVIGTSTIHCPQVNVQKTSNLAAAILDSALPVTPDSIYSINNWYSELNDIENIGADIGVSTILSQPAYKQCTSGLAAGILVALLPVTSNSIVSVVTS